MSLALRPTWSVELACASEDVIDSLSGALAAQPLFVKRARVPGGGEERGRRARDHFQISVPAARQRVWTPWLAIDVTPADRGTVVRARFSPHPTVWTGFAFGYLTLGTSLVLALCVLAAGAMVPGDGFAWAPWLAAGLGAALLLLWIAAQVGKRLGHAQMDELRGELDRALAACGDRLD